MSDVNPELKLPKKPIQRFEWLDQFRGIVIMLFIIAAITWILSGDFTALGSNQYTNVRLPVGPSYLNHGWKWADTPEGWPQMITIIDIGQQIFIFLVGFMQAFSFIRRKTTNSEKDALIHIIRRFFIIMALAFLDEILIGQISDGFDINTWNWYGWFWHGTLGNIAWASLAGGLVAFSVRKADTRFLIGMGILLLHAILYAIPAVVEWRWLYPENQTFFRIPFETIGHVAIAIIGAAFTGWMFDENREVSEPNIRNRILPISTGMFILMYIIDFLQPANHQAVNAALATMAIAASGFMLFIFYQLDKYNFKVPGLSAFGKNMLLMFILSLIVTEAYMPGVKDLAQQNAVYGLILAGIVPVLIMYAIAKFLEWRNWIIKI
jgi:hypothetical protein